MAQKYFYSAQMDDPGESNIKAAANVGFIFIYATARGLGAGARGGLPFAP